MKNVIKLSLAALLLAAANLCQAQLGVSLGLNMSNLTENDDDGDYDQFYKTKIGYNLGVFYNSEINDMFSIQPGIRLSTKGADIEFAGIEGSVSLSYLEIPIDLRLNFELGDNVVFGAIGPYLGYGIGGTSKIDGEDDEDVNFGTDEEEDDIKPMVVGLGISGGIIINQLMITIGYDMDLTNSAISDENGYTLKNSNIRLSFGYLLGE